MSTIAAMIPKVRRLYRKRHVREAELMMFEAVNSAIRETLEKLHGVDPKETTHLVHYTRLDVLFCILDPSSSANGRQAGLRPYDTVHANDPEEGMFVPRHWPANPHWGWDIERTEDPTSQLAERIAASSPAHTLSFVRSCASKPMNDQLTFWKEYGNGGKGCSLSIPVEKFVKHAPCLKPYCVRYGSKSVKRLFAALDKKLLLPIIKITESADFDHDFHETIRKMVLDALQPFRYLYKDENYAHEQECRIVITQHGQPPLAQDVIYEPRAGINGTTKFRHYPPTKVVGPDVLFNSDTEIRLGPLVAYKQNLIVVIENLLRRYSESRINEDEMMDRTPMHPPSVGLSEIHYRES